MGALNLCQFIGNVGSDLELRKTQSGKSVTSFSVAVTKKVKGEPKTTWIRATAWEKTAELACQYLRKGSSVYLSGEMQNSEYEKEGVKHYKTEIIVYQMQFLGGKQDGQQSTPQQFQQQAPEPVGGDQDTLPF